MIKLKQKLAFITMAKKLSKAIRMLQTPCSDLHEERT
jgi:hypothetical protein